MTTELVNIAAEKNRRFLCGILSPTAALENPKTSCHDHVYSEQTKCVLTTGDTVCFEGPLGHSRQIGRIIELYRSDPTSGDLEQLSFGSFDRSDDYFFQIRMLLPCEGHDAIEDLQIPHNNNTCVQLPELVQTNLYCVISACQVKETGFVLHLDDCINQKYGPVDQRQNTYFVRYDVIFSAICKTCYTPILNSLEYLTFGPHTQTKCGIVTSTERRLTCLAHVSRIISNVMSGDRTVLQPQRLEIPFDKDMWYFLRDQMCPFATLVLGESVNSTIRLELPNLAVGTGHVSSVTETLTIESREEFSSLKMLFGCAFGIHVLKENPSGADVHVAQLNPLPLLSTDSINCLEQALDPLDKECKEKFQTFVRFEYNYAMGTLTITVKFSFSGVSFVSGRLKRYFSKPRLRTRFGNIWMGMRLEINDDEWEVAHVHKRKRQVLLTNISKKDVAPLHMTEDEVLKIRGEQNDQLKLS